MTNDDASHFARVIACESCSPGIHKKLQRDEFENVPQPGYIGLRYAHTRVVLAGQNPGVCPPSMSSADAIYTRALRAVRDDPNATTMRALSAALRNFIPTWPVHGKYFPLAECGLTLDDIAYFNVVRCRTVGNAVPGRAVVSNCAAHFATWLDWLRPRLLIFIGKFSHDAAAHLATARGIPVAYMNRRRSLSGAERAANREAVVQAIRSALSK